MDGIAKQQQPVLVQFDPVCVEDLLTENADSDVEGLLAQIDSKEGFMRDVVERQSNFRLVKGHGRIARVYVVEIDDDGDPMPTYSLKEINDSETWR